MPLRIVLLYFKVFLVKCEKRAVSYGTKRHSGGTKVFPVIEMCIKFGYNVNSMLMRIKYFERYGDIMKIMPNRMDRGFQRYQDEFEKKAVDVLRSGWYVLGREVEQFEKEFAAYTGAAHCVGLASGLDALWLAFKILGIGEGDEVLAWTEGSSVIKMNLRKKQ